MKKIFSLLFLAPLYLAPLRPCDAEPIASAHDFVSADAYNTMYPYMDNQMRLRLNPGTIPNKESSTGISAIVRTNDGPVNGRRVVVRTPENYAAAARTATARAVAPTTIARSGMTTAAGNVQGQSNVIPTRRVVSRGGMVQNATVRAGSRGDNSIANAAANANPVDQTIVAVSSNRCLADYTTCMNGYCARETSAYNRCYCSAQLSQIDAEYQPAIETLIKKILVLREGSGTYTSAEMNAYWDQVVGQYTGDNSWVNLDNALNINWADTESRVRGQNAFLTGHEYCVQNLRGCFYMAANLRDAYRSDISRDCAIYKNGLQKIKAAAESVVESYSE